MKMLLSSTTGIYKSDEEAIRVMADAGFDAYDFGLSKNKVESLLSGDDYIKDIENMKKLSKELNIICNQAHAPFPTGFKGVDEYNEEMFQLNVRAMECAAIVGAESIVSHPITNLGEHLLSDEMRSKIIPFENMEECKKINMMFYKRLEPYCEKFNIKIAIENMWIKDTETGKYYPYATGNAKDLADYIDALDSEWFGACLDIGHSYLVGENPAEEIRILGNRIIALHVNDNRGRSDAHIMPYLGKTNWAEVLQALAEIGYEGHFTFEVSKRDLPDELNREWAVMMCHLGRYMISEIEIFSKDMSMER